MAIDNLANWHFQARLAALSALLFLSGCDAFEDGSTRAPEVSGPNVALASISPPPASSYAAGEPISFDFEVEADQVEAEQIGVHFSLIEAEKADQLVTELDAETHDLGEVLIENLLPGRRRYTANLIIPETISETGTYLLVAAVDPSGVVGADVNPDDNLSRGFSVPDVSPTVATVSLEADLFSDFILHKIEVGKGFILLPEPESGAAAETGPPSEIESDIVGYIDAERRGSGVLSARISAAVVINGVPIVAHLWDEERQRYEDSTEIVFPNSLEPHYFPWDIGVNGALQQAIFAVYDETAEENLLTLQFTITDLSDVGEATQDNNIVELSVPFRFFTPTPEEGEQVASSAIRTSKALMDQAVGALNRSRTLTFSRSFDHRYGDRSKFAIGVDVSTKNVVRENRFEASFDSEGSFELYIFNNRATLFSAHASGFAFGDTAGAGYDVGVSILGLEVLAESDSVSDRLQKSYDLSWEEEQELFEADFVVAIVPLTVKAGVSGSIGFGAGFGFDNLVLEASGDIFSAEMGAFAEAEINLGVASGGVGGEFVLISEGLSVTGTADLSRAATNRRITLEVDVDNELQAIEGDLFLFVRYPTYKWCCSFPKKEARKTIYDTGALYDKTWSLLSRSSTLSF